MRCKNLDPDDIEYLIDLLFDSKLSKQEIAQQLNISMKALNETISLLGLGWVKTSRKKMSRGQTALTDIMKKLLPGQEIVNEYHIGNRLRLDVYCPEYKLAAEFHGRQHFHYTGLFFESKYDFEEAQKRDQQKAELCEQKGITLVVFRYNDELTEEAVYNRLIQAIRGSGNSVDNSVLKSKKYSTFYQDRKKQHSEYRKLMYRKLKDERSRKQ